MGLVDGKTAVITGGAGGLGLAMAHTLLAEGANVVLTDVSSEALQRALNELDRPGRTATSLGSGGCPGSIRIPGRLGQQRGLHA
jgi:3-oxoacyl-[acyl-carrier protein] reductase